MTDSEDSPTIRIELHGASVEGICRMISKVCGSDASNTNCCESPREQCCPQTEDIADQEFTIVIKRKG